MRFNLLPCIPLNPTVMKSLSMEGRISRITKHMKLETPECAYLVAKPFPTHSENLWRITVNNIEDNIAQKISDVTECGGQCIFALTLLSEQFLAEKKNKGMVSYYLIRMALLQEFLKFPNAMYWKAGYFTVRLDSLLRSLEAHVSRKDFKNIFTGVNMISHREKEKLMELLNDIARLREQFMGYFS